MEVSARAPFAASPGLWRLAWRRLLRDPLGVTCLAIVLAFMLMIAASWLGIVAANWNDEVGVSYASPTFLGKQINLEAASVAQDKNIDPPPPAADLRAVDPLADIYEQLELRTKAIQSSSPVKAETLSFGGDKWGRDIVAKTIKGGEASIFVGFVAALLAVLLGTIFGALAGYFGGWINDFLEWFYNVFTSIPYILLILAFAAVLGKGLFTVIMILGITGWTGIYRLVRAEYLKHAARDYVRAAEAIGASHVRRMFVHILPNISHVILIQLSQHVVQFIKAEVILSFLGFGVGVDMVSWGTMLAEAQNELVIGKWWQLTAAGAMMALVVTAFSLLTDALRDALDPKLYISARAA